MASDVVAFGRQSMKKINYAVLEDRQIMDGGIMEKKRQEAVDKREGSVGGKMVKIVDKVGNRRKVGNRISEGDYACSREGCRTHTAELEFCIGGSQ